MSEHEARRHHEAWRHAMVEIGTPDHPFQEGAVYKRSCIGHVLVPQPSGRPLTKPCTMNPEQHHVAMQDWDKLTASGRVFWRLVVNHLDQERQPQPEEATA